MSNAQSANKRSGTGSSHFLPSGKRKLESIFLFTTGNCNANCAHCFYSNDMATKEPDLTFDEIKKISETAGDINRLWLSGGEPTLREDLPEIIELFYKNNHTKDVNLPTNGIKGGTLIEWVKRLRTNCPTLNISVAISLDGFEATHNKQRGVPIFYNAIETLQKLENNFANDAHVVANVATCVTKYNYDEIVDLFSWIYGRFTVATHTTAAARGTTRVDDVKLATEKTQSAINDAIAPFLMAYAKRMGEGVSGLARPITKFIFAGIMRAMYNAHAANLDRPQCWGVDCTAGETTLVIDHDGRFRACEMREPIGKVQDYDCDVQRIMFGDAMKKELETIGHGYKANCWCSHSCWLMASIVFSPLKMLSAVSKGYGEVKKLSKGELRITETDLQVLEKKYKLDIAKLQEIGVVA
ncbi:MAG: hypothetical protein Ta2A_04910 [Treponemataceae bacterium]|nr:MAG: hypothetical protein Ta2A_04910 [Treponemataceae bacterium]